MQKHIPRKRFGQHFLCDTNVIRDIIAALNPQRGDHVVEIGPGLGALTTQLLPLLEQLEVVELDRDLISPLKILGEKLGKLIIHQADALRFDFSQLTDKPASLRVIGNLPYNITTPLLFHLLATAAVIQDMLFMLQKEVAERIVAQPGEEAYGRLSVMVQYFCQTEILFAVGPECFMPPPKVDSAIIRLLPYRELPFVAQDYLLFEDVVRLAFNQRRKTLRNSLHTRINQQQLLNLNIDPELRAERLSVSDYVKIANGIYHLQLGDTN